MRECYNVGPNFGPLVNTFGSFDGELNLGHI